MSEGRRPFLPTDPEEAELIPRLPLRRRLADWLVIGVLTVVIVVGGVIGIGLLGQFLSGVEIAITDVEPGTCFNTSGPLEGGDFPNIWVADCAGEHHGEVIARLTWPAPDDSYPSTSAMKAFVAPRCRSAFQAYVGIDHDASEFELSYTYPAASAWGRSVRAFACVVLGPRGSNLTGSVRGSQR